MDGRPTWTLEDGRPTDRPTTRAEDTRIPTGPRNSKPCAQPQVRRQTLAKTRCPGTDSASAVRSRRLVTVGLFPGGKGTRPLSFGL